MNTELYTNETLKTSNSALQSSGNNVFSSPAYGSTLTLDGSSPSNNYAGASIRVFLYGKKLNTYIYRRIEKITINARMQSGYSDGFLYASAFEQTYKNNVSLPICPQSVSGIVDRETGDVTIIIPGDAYGLLAQDCMMYDMILCGRGTVVLNSISVSVTYSSPYSISDVGETPTNGSTSNLNSPITFAWQILSEFYLNNPDTSNRLNSAKSFKFSWKNESGDITIKDISTGVPSLEIPAGEFLNNSQIEWQVTGEMEHSVPINAYPIEPVSNPNHKGWFTLYLVDMDGDAIATIISPNNISVDGSAPIYFNWTHYNSSGTAQTRADIQTGSTPDTPPHQTVLQPEISIGALEPIMPMVLPASGARQRTSS